MSRQQFSSSYRLPWHGGDESSLLVMEIDEEPVPSGTMFRDLEKVYNTLESTLPCQRPRDVGERDGKYRGHNDVTVTHAIAASHFDVTALPDPNGTSDLAPADAIAKLFSEDHERLASQASTTRRNRRYSPWVTGDLVVFAVQACREDRPASGSRGGDRRTS
jgi:hypothetical protein